MDEAKLKRKKIIIGATSMLCVIVVGVGIAIGIGIIAGQKNNQPEAEVDDNSGGEEIDISELSGKERLYYEYDDEREKIDAEAEKLFSENSVKVKKIKELYLDHFSECMAYEAYTLANAYLVGGAKAFLSHNMKKEALEILTSVEVDAIPGVDGCIRHLNILSLAEELGENEIASEYRTIVNNESDSLGDERCGSSSMVLIEEVKYRSE